MNAATDCDLAKRSTARFGWRDGRLLPLSVMMLSFGWCLPCAMAQDGGGSHEVFIATVKNPEETSQIIKVSRNKSVIIETTIPVRRVEAVGEEIVRVDVVTPKQLIVTGNQYGVTQVMVWSDSGERHIFEVHVELDLTQLNAYLRDIDPQSTAIARSLQGNIIITGEVSGANIVQQIDDVAQLFVSGSGEGENLIINQTHVVGEQQVQLRVVVAEMNRSATRELGVSGFLAGENVRDGFLINQIGGNSINIAPPTDIDVTSVIPFVTGDIANSAANTLTLGFPRAQLEMFLEAMRENSLLRVLAEPTLVAVSGETAHFLAGGEFPIPVPQAGSATGAITIEFREFGVNLAFTPLVLPHQKIRLRVRPEVSSRDDTQAIVTNSGIVVPALVTRRAETTVIVDNGATLAMAGLLQDQLRGVVNRVPGIGDLPILGSLFRSIEYQRSRSELVIFVTPEIVDSTYMDELPPLPGEDVVVPNDFEVFFEGAIEGKPRVEDVADDGDDELAFQIPLQPSQPLRLSLHGEWGYSEIPSYSEQGGYLK